MRRRDVLTLLGGAATWPNAARAQQDSVRRIGVLVASAENDADIQARLAGFFEALDKLGWSNDHNLRIDIHYAASGLRPRSRMLLKVTPPRFYPNLPTPPSTR
jgi:putative tryptophan/tyrosine transport system substrate-binding protein